LGKFTQILSEFAQTYPNFYPDLIKFHPNLPKFAQKNLLGDAATFPASPTLTALHKKTVY